MPDDVLRPDAFAGQRVLVTGGSSGIGLAIAQAFALHGAEVHILSRDAARLARAQAAIRKACDAGGDRRTTARLPTHAADVRDAAAVEQVAHRLAALGGADVLVNAAAGNFPLPFEQMSLNAWSAVVDIVLHGTANLSRTVGLDMLRRSRADGRVRSVLNIVAGYAWTGAPGVAHSGAAKAGVLNLTRSLAVEWAPHVRVNAVSPGPIDGTEGVRRLADGLGLRSAMERAVPMRRLGRGDEVAQTCLWLASPSASFVTGACLPVDGGMDAKGPFGDVLLS